MAYLINVVGSWGDLNQTIAKSTESEVIVDLSAYEPKNAPYSIIIPTNITALIIKSNKLYSYELTVTATNRTTPVGLVLENIIIQDFLNNQGIIDISRNLLNNTLVLNNTVMVNDVTTNGNVSAVRVAQGTRLDIQIYGNTVAEMYSTPGSAIIGGLKGESSGVITFTGTGTLLLHRKSTDTGAAIGGGAGAGGGFIYIGYSPIVKFVVTGTGTPTGKDIGNGANGSGTYLISIDTNLTQSVNPTHLVSFWFAYGLPCPQVSIYNGPVYLVSKQTAKILGVGVFTTSGGEIQFYSDVEGTYYFSSTPLVQQSITGVFYVPKYVDNQTFYFPCNKPSVGKGINLF